MIEAEARALGLPTATVTLVLAATGRPTLAAHLACAITADRGTAVEVADLRAAVVAGLFVDPSDAIAAAVEGRCVDGSSAFGVAVHTGDVVVSGELRGATVDRAVALLAAGRGGQVLVSDATASAVLCRLPPGVALVDRGIHRLADLGRPERVWQVTVAGDAEEVVDVRSLAAFQHNLPTPLTPLIGRRADIDEAARVVGAERLVTVIGPGGVGKTRFAAAVAATCVERFPGGVWWVELAAVTTGAGVPRAVLAVLRATEAPGVDAAAQLAAALGDEPSLLVLDNCEHLVDDCRGLVAGLLVLNASVSLLATSREPLGVPGEVTWRLRSLDSPPLDDRMEASALYRSDASRLFVERAVRAHPSLRVDADGARAIGLICHRLDGIPLAIELASARCRHVNPVQISRELDDRFRVLTGGARTVARHQTLAVSVEWSYDRLDEVEQRTFRRLAVFTGPFPFEAAHAVVAGLGDVDAGEVFDVVTRLVDKSLVVNEEGVLGEPRYRLLETLRAFGLGRAAEAGEVDRLRDLNARWWAAWLDRHFDEIHTDDMVERVEELHDNLVAALEWSVGDPELGLFLLARVARAWWVVDRPGDGLSAIERLLTGENAAAHPGAWVDAASVAMMFVQFFRRQDEAKALLNLLEATAAALDDEYRLVLARYLNFAPHLAEEVRALARQRGDRFVEGMAVIQLSTLLMNEDPEHADEHLAEANALARTDGSSLWGNFVREGAAHAARDVGDLARGIELATALACSRSTMNVSSSVWLLDSIGLLAMDEDAVRLAVRVAERRLPNLPASNADLAQARARLRLLTEGARGTVAPDFETSPWMNGSMWFVCREAIDAGEEERALTVVRAQAPLTSFGQAVLAAVEAAVGGDDDRWREALCLAAERGLRPIAVDALEGLGVAAARRERWTESMRMFAAAERLRDETGYRWRFCCEREVVEPARRAVVEALGEDAWHTAGEQALEWREAAAYAARARGRRQRPRHGWDSLTPTELQVAELVAEGHTNPQIAQRLLMGRATVKSHLEHVFTKLDVSSRAELAALVVRRSGS